MLSRKRPIYQGDGSLQHYCQGYLDSNDQWNTGFFCPSSGGATVVCCGNDTYKYCCATTTTAPTLLPTHQSHLTTPDIISVSVTSLGVAVSTVCFLTLCAIIVFVVLNRRNNCHTFSSLGTGQDDIKTTDHHEVFTISTSPSAPPCGVYPETSVSTISTKYWHKVKQLIQQHLTQLNVI